MTARIIGLFSGICRSAGGIETSAIEAWDAVRLGRPARLVVYDATGRALPLEDELTVAGASKLCLAARLLARSWPAETLLCWHLGLLKLVPFLRGFSGRICLFVHGIEAWKPPAWLTRRLLDRVDHFLTNSRFTWERFLSFEPALAGRRHTTIPLGLGVPLSIAVPSPATPPAALILGRMAKGEDYKGHRELIGCWPQVLARIPNAQLWVAGDGDLRPELQSFARHTTCPSAVRFFGQVSEQQKAELLAQCRCLAMPSRGEGFGLVYLEAMRVGRPCLVSDQDAGREVVNPPEAGLAVNPTDPSALAAAVSDLMTPGPQWDKWSAAARGRYETNFTAKHFARRLTDAVFEEVESPLG
jgi:phosphatidylinositol alpha-1,6-mannosyltransferase